MAYLGRDVDKISNIETLDNITFDGSSSYTLQKNSVNFVPSSANAILISIDGVVQSGNFTVSGSTIDFGTAIAGTSTCNFIIHLGVGLITSPSDGSVTTAKLQDDAVTKDKVSNLMYPAFDAYITSNQTVTSGSVTKATFNNEVLDTDSCYDASTNYRFTPTVAGKYYIYLNLGINGSAAGRLFSAYGMIYKNGAEVTKYHLNTQNENIFYANHPAFVIVDMNGSSDYIEAYGEANTTIGSPNFQSGAFSRFGGFRIGD